MLRGNHFLWIALLSLAAHGAEIRAGVSASHVADTLPLVTRGYEVYMVGEMHGLEQNAAFQLEYLKLLHRDSNLRDVAIEEDAVYENDGQAYVDGRSNALSPHLCLRAPILEGIRRLNSDLPRDAHIRIHLTDIDWPAEAIRLHLEMIQQQLGAKDVKLPAESEIKAHGLHAVAELRQLNPDSITQSELRTIELSILSLQQGLEVDIGPTIGTPYLDSRESAVTDNIVDLIRKRGVASLLVVYGSDHVSRYARGYGGPNKNQRFTPTGLRLGQSGLKVFTIVTLPLAGRVWWRGQSDNIIWTPEDGHLSSGETFDKLLAAAPDARFFYIDAKREHATMPADDISRMLPDAFLLFRSGTPMANPCATR